MAALWAADGCAVGSGWLRCGQRMAALGSARTTRAQLVLPMDVDAALQVEVYGYRARQVRLGSALSPLLDALRCADEAMEAR